MYNIKNINSEVPFFSIVIASLNNVHGLLECIESINSQDFQSYEVLISDGGSIDGTLSLLSGGHIRNLKWWKSKPDSGIYHALNSAIVEANGDWILVLGSDDKFSDSTALSRAFAVIYNNKKSYSLMYSDILIRTNSTTRLKTYPDFEDFCDKFAGAPFIHHQSAFVSRKSMLNVGLFNTYFRIHADYDLVLQIIKSHPAFKINDTFVVFNANGYSSKLKNVVRSFNEIRFVRQKNGFKQLNMRILLIYFRALFRYFFEKLNLIRKN